MTGRTPGGPPRPLPVQRVAFEAATEAAPFAAAAEWIAGQDPDRVTVLASHFKQVPEPDGMGYLLELFVEIN